MPDKFEKFTQRARKVFLLAQEEAQRLNHNYIGTEHLLLGLAREGEGIAARLLAGRDVQLPKVRTAVEFIIGKGDGEASDGPGLTSRARKAIELAMDEARRLNNPYINTEHLLLGLMRESDGTAAKVLESLGVELEMMRKMVAQVASQPFSYQQPKQQGAMPTTGSRDIADKFTERATRVFELAQEEVARFNHNYIGTEHILLGLVREGDGIAARVLTDLGVQLPKVRSALEFIIGRGDGLVVGDPGLTPRSKKVITLAMDEAQRLNHHYIGTEHLLLGLVREGEGIAAGILESLGVSLGKVRQAVMQIVSPGAADATFWQPSTQQSGQRTMQLVMDLPDEEVIRLAVIARQHACRIEDLVHEAIQQVWLSEHGDTDASASPPPSMGEES